MRPASSSRGADAGTVGLVAFGHEALALTAPAAPESDVEQVLASLAPDAETGTALYDAVGLSVAHLKRMADGTRILVLLTDGHDLGSKSTLAQAIAAAKRANVIVYAIAAGSRVGSPTSASSSRRLPGADCSTPRIRLASERRTAPWPGSSTERGRSPISHARTPATGPR